MLSFLNCKLINNYVKREVIISQAYYPYSNIRYIKVVMYSFKRIEKRKLFTRIYEVSKYKDFDSMYYRLLEHYKECTCKKPYFL